VEAPWFTESATDTLDGIQFCGDPSGTVQGQSKDSPLFLKSFSKEVVVKTILERLGNGAAIVGVLLCLMAGLARVAGAFYLGGFELMTLFMGGMALMLAACLAKLHLLGMAGR
jgi:type IV secretory pathway VirB2 component (pilin)